MSLTRRLLGQASAKFADLKVWNQDVGKILDDTLSKLRNTALGYPTPHEITHLVHGTDQLQTPGLPKGVGINTSIGQGPSYAREDHEHAFTAWAQIRTYVSLRVG
jgi:hypothetical protein